jgi:hypothetical protein
VAVTERIRWEVQWHPANGARIRRLAITSRGVRRLVFTMGIAAWVIFAGGVLAGLEGILTRFEIDVARRQNTALRAQQEALREQALELAVRVFDGVERGRRVARLADLPARAREGQGLRLLARDAGNDAILIWSSQQSSRLDALGNELAAGRFEIGGMQAFLPAPASSGTAPVCNAAVLQVADVRSVAR